MAGAVDSSYVGTVAADLPENKLQHCVARDETPEPKCLNDRYATVIHYRALEKGTHTRPTAPPKHNEQQETVWKLGNEGSKAAY